MSCTHSRPWRSKAPTWRRTGHRTGRLRAGRHASELKRCVGSIPGQLLLLRPLGEGHLLRNRLALDCARRHPQARRHAHRQHGVQAFSGDGAHALLTTSITKMSMALAGIFGGLPASPSAAHGRSRHDKSDLRMCARACSGCGHESIHASCHGMNISHLSPTTMSCIASVHPLIT